MHSFLHPKTILITGASRGLGRALALAYAAPGITLLLHARNAAALNEAAAACTASGAVVSTILEDATHTEPFQAKIREAIARSPIDLLIVNAGVTSIAGPEGESWEAVQRVFATNLHAAIATVDSVLPLLRERKHGQIALVSSLAAYVGMPITPSYSASKAALKNYGESLRPMLAPLGIGVTVLLPGFIESDMSAQFPAQKPFLMRTDEAAQRIKRALTRNPAYVAFPQPLAFGMWCLQFLPASLAQTILRWSGCGTPSR